MGCTILGLRLYRKLGKNLKINKFIYKPKSIINNSTPSKIARDININVIKITSLF